MVRFLKSIELWTAITLMVVFSFLLGNGNFMDGFGALSNLKQNLEWIAWAYVIHRLHVHHRHITSLFGDTGGDNDERSDS